MAIAGITDAITRMDQIQAQIASIGSAFSPQAAAGSTTGGAGLTSGPGAAAATYSAGSAAPGSSTAAANLGTRSDAPTSSFASQLTSALGVAGTQTTSPVTGLVSTGAAAGTGGAALPAAASTMLTSGQQRFASRLAADTGLDAGVVSAWVLSEESGGAAVSRQSAGNNDWLNIGYTDSATYGANGSQWSDPVTAADATAGWLKGQDTIPGYGTASSGIQAILSTAGQPATAQISALQTSGWASSGYPSLPSLYAQLAG